MCVDNVLSLRRPTSLGLWEIRILLAQSEIISEKNVNQILDPKIQYDLLKHCGTMVKLHSVFHTWKE